MNLTGPADEILEANRAIPFPKVTSALLGCFLASWIVAKIHAPAYPIYIGVLVAVIAGAVVAKKRATLGLFSLIGMVELYRVGAPDLSRLIPGALLAGYVIALLVTSEDFWATLLDRHWLEQVPVQFIVFLLISNF